MQRDTNTILQDIRSFQLQNGAWLPLEDLLTELWATPVPARALPILFGVFERFSDDDGAGVLWSIVHGVESLEHDYGPALQKSLAKQTSEMGEVMMGRLERARERTNVP